MKGMLMKNKYGFSLIELMVVIVIVIILALALTPLFKEEIEKARYSEGISALGALNTKIKVYIAENNALPRRGSSASRSAATNTVRLVNSPSDYHGFMLSGSNDLNTADRPYVQTDLGIGYQEYEGRYFKQDHYQYCNVRDNIQSDGTYLYGVAVIGGQGSSSNDISKAGPGTYYAVCVRQTSNEFITVTKADYSPTDKAPKILVSSTGDGITPATRQIPLPNYNDDAAAIATDGWK